MSVRDLSDLPGRTVTADLGTRRVSGRVLDVDHGLESLRAAPSLTISRGDATITVPLETLVD